MTIYNKPDYSIGVWAEEGTITQPTSEKIELGHVVEKPPFEMVNYIENRQDTAIAYLFQNGIPSWDVNDEYPKDAFVKLNGIVYKSKNLNSEAPPNSNPDIWSVAWADNQSVEDLKAIINEIRNTEGYLNLYVSKANPVMTGKATGVGYTANKGLTLDGSDNVGYAFNEALSTGIFNDGNDTVVQKNGEVVGKFNTALEQTADNKSFVTMDVLLELLRIKVGDLYTTTSPENPETRLGYGTWEKFAKGRTLVGHSDDYTSNTPDWVKTGGNNYGNYVETIKANNLPTVTNYRYLRFTNEESGDISVGRIDPNGNAKYNKWETVTGTSGDTPMNIVQPSTVVYIWKRIA